jgi:hypothetical protein
MIHFKLLRSAQIGTSRDHIITHKLLWSLLITSPARGRGRREAAGEGINRLVGNDMPATCS